MNPKIKARNDAKLLEQRQKAATLPPASRDPPIAVCCVWGCRPVRVPILTPVPCRKCQQRAREHQNWTMEQWEKIDLVRLITFSFTSRGWPGACPSLTWGTRGHQDALWEEGKQVEAVWCFGQCSDLGACHQCGCYFDMYHLPKHCCRLCKPFHGNSIPWWLVPHSKRYGVLTWPPNFPDLNPIKHLWDVLDKAWRPNLAIYRT